MKAHGRCSVCTGNSLSSYSEFSYGLLFKAIISNTTHSLSYKNWDAGGVHGTTPEAHFVAVSSFFLKKTLFNNTQLK